MTEISALYALPHAFTGQERQWYRGLAVLAGTDGQPEVVPVVNPDAFATAAAAPASVPRFSAQGAAL